MSRPVVIVIALILLLGLLGGGILGWMSLNRDRVGVLKYQVQVAEGVSMREVIEKEEKLMKSDQVLKQVIKNLGLIDQWRMDSEEEALAHMRSKLILKEDRVGEDRAGEDRAGVRVRVLYRDRKQARALEILQEIKKIFTPVRLEAVRKNELLPIAPRDAEASEGGFKQTPLPVSP